MELAMTRTDATDRPSTPMPTSSREECGVFGIFGHPDAAAHHRARPARPPASRPGGGRHRLLRRQPLPFASAISASSATPSPNARGHRAPAGRRSAIGHIRYSTTGETILRNVQPLFAELAWRRLRRRPQRQPHQRPDAAPRPASATARSVQSTSDTEVHPPSRRPQPQGPRFDRPLHRRAPARSRAPIALVGLTNKKLIGARDPLGIRPLVLGELDGAAILASETCALDIIGARFVRDVEHGEGRGDLADDGIETLPARSRRADRASASSNTSISPARIPSSTAAASMRCARRMGAELALEVAGGGRRGRCRCPDSGMPAAIGYRAGRPASPSSSASSATTMSAGPSSSRPRRSATLGVKLKHNANRARDRGQAHRAGRRLDRARHHLGEDRADDARGRRQGGAYAHRQAADHPSGLSTASTRRSSEKLLAATHDARGDAPVYRRGFARLPVDRRPLPRHGL